MVDHSLPTKVYVDGANAEVIRELKRRIGEYRGLPLLHGGAALADAVQNRNKRIGLEHDTLNLLCRAHKSIKLSLLIEKICSYLH